MSYIYTVEYLGKFDKRAQAASHKMLLNFLCVGAYVRVCVCYLELQDGSRPSALYPA